jgi:hypothetical protein
MRLLPLLLVGCFCHAAVTRVDVTERSNDAGYERVAGEIHFAVDPKLAPNQIIADIDLAPRNAEGKVEFSADFSMMRPLDPARRNGTALVDIPNRGSKTMLGQFNLGDRFLLDQGFTLVWVGWEFDVRPAPGLFRLDAPIATDHGKPIVGLVRSEWEGGDGVGSNPPSKAVTTIPLGDRDLIGYPVADEHDAANQMFVRDTVDGQRRVIPRGQWSFADATHVTIPAGFVPGKIYEVVYKAKDPVLVGLGPAAVRDTVSYLKYGGIDSAIDDFHKDIRRAVGFGVSQSGRFLRTFLYDGFNEDEKNRRVFDGVWADIAGAGRGGFNARFAQPSRDGHPFFNILYPVDIPPFTDEDGLLAKAKSAGVVPKIFYTNGSYEYWGRAASLIHTTPDGRQDVQPAADTRIYFFPGSQHGSGGVPPRHIEAQNPASMEDYRIGMRALLVAMEAWLADGKQPPQSQYPRVSKDQLVAVSAYAFPKIPGVATPQFNRRAFRLDFSVEPPKLGPPFPTLVPQVNVDGNETSGVRMPDIQVPLASNTGWNLRSPRIGAPDQLYSMAGSSIPFAMNKAEREKSSDPRASIDERYPTKDDYMKKIAAAAQQLIKEGYLLDRDLDNVRALATREWNYVTEPRP